MSQTVAQLLDAALALSEDERAELSELLVASLTSPSLHPAWPAELRRRSEEIESGKVKCVPWDDVRRAAQARIEIG